MLITSEEHLTLSKMSPFKWKYFIESFFQILKIHFSDDLYEISDSALNEGLLFSKKKCEADEDF